MAYFGRVKGISEAELVIPAVMIMSRSQYAEGGITISDLMPLLREALRPTGHDLRIIPNRKEDFFSQKVRNLVSHKTLQKLGLATLQLDGGVKRYLITEKGKKVADAHASKVGRNIDDLVPDQMVLPLNELAETIKAIKYDNK